MAREKSVRGFKELSKVKPGYKLVKTLFQKVIEIPEEWEFSPLDSVIEKKNKSIEPSDFPEEQFELYSIPSYHESANPEIAYGNDIHSLKNFVDNETVLFGKINPDLPKIWFVSSSTELRKIASTEFILLKANLKTNAKFLFYLSWSEFLYGKCKSFVSGTTPSRERVEPRPFLQIPIPLPSTKEQEKIATILSNIDDLILSYNEIISQTERLKQGLMQTLLAKGICHKKFKNSELGNIPEDWKVTRLGSIAKLQGGYAFKSEDYVESGIQLLKITNVSHGKTVWGEQSFVPNEYYEKYADFQIKYGDIVLAMTRPIISGGLKISIFTKTERTLLNQRVGKFNIRHMNNDFFYHLLNHRYFFNQISSRLSESNQPNISSGEIEKIWIAYPSKIEEQQKITAILNSVDEKISDLETKKKLLEYAKKGLMQKLLTGQIRVNL